MLSAAEGKHVQEAQADFPFTFPSRQNQPAQETGCKFQHRVYTKKQCQAQLPRGAGTGSVLLEAKGNPAWAAFMGGLGLEHTFQSRDRFPSSHQGSVPLLWAVTISLANRPHTFTPVISAKLQPFRVVTYHRADGEPGASMPKDWKSEVALPPVLFALCHVLQPKR